MNNLPIEVRIKKEINNLRYSIAYLKSELEDVITTNFEKVRLLEIESEINLNAQYLKWLELGDYKKLPYPI